MAYAFTASDVFEMAIQLEKNGALFYRNAAESVEEASEKQILSHLALMEEDHGRQFALMQQELPPEETRQTAFDPDGEAIGYLKALADTRVFFEKENPGGSIVDILKSALLAEKDSIVFYLGMKDLVPSKLGRSRIDTIIREEMGHIRILSTKLAEFNR